MNAVNDKTGVYGENIFTFGVHTNKERWQALEKNLVSNEGRGNCDSLEVW